MKSNRISSENTKKKRPENRNKNYIICVLLMLVLLIGAVTGPQLLFAVQDSHAQNDIYLGERDGMDVTALNSDYPRELQTRMLSLSSGLAEGRQYYAYATDYEVNEECYTIVENAVWLKEGQEWQDWAVILIDSIPLFPDAYYGFNTYGYDVTVWKRYVICDENFEEGVAIMAWYFEIRLSEEMQIKLLVDTEDYTLYAIWFDNIEDYYMYRFDTNLITMMSVYWLYYYDADNAVDKMYEKYLEEMGVMDDESVVASAIIGEEYATRSEEYNEDILAEKLKMLISTKQYDLPLLYGENQLNWKLQMTEDDLSHTPKLCMGVQEIWELIPEFPQAE